MKEKRGSEWKWALKKEQMLFMTAIGLLMVSAGMLLIVSKSTDLQITGLLAGLDAVESDAQDNFTFTFPLPDNDVQTLDNLSQENLFQETTADVFPLALANRSACGTVNANLTLGGGTITANSSCFVINASNIVLNGNGTRVVGNFTGNGANATHFDNVTIRNLQLFNFTRGILAANSTGLVLFNNTIVTVNSSAHAIELGVGTSRIRRANVTKNNITTYGSLAAGIIYIAANSTFTENAINTSVGAGIYSAEGRNNTFLSNKVITNSTTQPALYILDSTDDQFISDVLNATGTEELDIPDVYIDIGTAYNVFLTNVTFYPNKNNIQFDNTGIGNLSVRWYFDATVQNASANSSLENVTITIRNTNNAVVFSGETNASGQIQRQILVEYVMVQGNTKTYNTPHTVNVNRSGFLSNTTTLNLISAESSALTFRLVESTLPNVFLNSPGGENISGNGVDGTGANFTFNWTAGGATETFSCNLTVDGTVNRSNITSTRGIAANVTVNDFTFGTRSWNVSCTDGAGNTTTSETRRFSVVGYITRNTTLGRDVILDYAKLNNFGLTAFFFVSNTTFDCNNKTIRVTGEGQDATAFLGGNNVAYNNVTIKNCVVEGFGTGIDFSSARNLTIENNTFRNHSNQAISLSQDSGSASLQTSDNRIRNNKMEGSSKTGYALNLNTIGKNNSITNNRISNMGFGIVVSGFGTGLIFEGNNLTDNTRAFHGIGENNTFTNNLVMNNSMGYVFSGNGKSNIFTSEKVMSNTRGIYIESIVSTTNNTFRDSTFTGNTADVNITAGVSLNMTFINSSVSRSKISTVANTKVFVRWYIDVNATDASTQQPLENVTVAARNSISGIEDSKKTNASGIARLDVTEFYQSDDINYFVTPAVITISKGNYTGNTTSVSLKGQTYASIAVKLAPVSCGATLAAGFELRNNYACAQDGFTIGADALAISGNGNNLTGSSTGAGIRIAGRKNITITNLRIQNFTQGVYLENTNGTHLSSMILTNNTYGIVFNNSNDNNISNVQFTNNANVSVFATNDGGTNNSLINTTINISDITVNGSATIFRKWYVDINATYNGNLSLSGAYVAGYFNSTINGTRTLDSANTTVNGFTRLVLTELKKNSTDTTFLTPHNITLTFTYLGTNITNSTVINLSQTNNTVVRLNIPLNCTSPVTGMSLTQNTTFCPGTFAATSIIMPIANTRLTCVDTILKDPAAGAEYTIGIRVKNNSITVEDCTLQDHYVGMYVLFDDLGTAASPNFIENVSLTNITLTGQYGIWFNRARRISVQNSTITPSGADIDNGGSLTLTEGSNFTIHRNVIGGLNKLWLERHENSTLTNNTFTGGIQGVVLQVSNGNRFYHNNFTGMTYFIVDDYNPASTGNTFNASVNISGILYNQGNSWDDYCDKGTDSNSDGYADTTKSGNDWPYRKSISSKLLFVGSDSAVTDYAPRILTCPPSSVQLGTSEEAASASAETGGGSPAAAPAPQEAGPQAAAAEGGGSYDPALASRYLKAGSAEAQRVGEDTFQVVVTLENTGTKSISLFPEIFQEIDDPFFIVTRKTLGFEGSLFSKIAHIAYSRTPVSGRLLKAEIQNPEQIVLAPGEKIEKVLEVKEGLAVPRTTKIRFTTFGETVTEKEVAVEKKAVSGTAVDIDAEGNQVDVYAIIVPAQLAEKLGEYYAEEAAKQKVTGAAVLDKYLKKDKEEYWLELSISKVESKSGGKTKKKPVFADLYGPYPLRREQSFIFAQQFSYDPKEYNGTHVMHTKVYKDGNVVVENEFEVEMG